MSVEGRPDLEQPQEGTLFVVSTPIGNLNDMTRRGLETLRLVDIIAAEDTRHSGKLLNHFVINTPLLSYHEHNAQAQLPQLLRRLAGGGRIALISDAGTPLISDPGYRLVEACHRAGYRVVPVPGASALTAAVSVAGVPGGHYYFEGFLPARQPARVRRLMALRERAESVVFYESCHRIESMLADLLEIFGGHRRAAFCREMTKTWETIRSMPLVELAPWVGSDPDQQRGEIVVVVAGCRDTPVGIDADTQRWLRALSGELSPARLAAAAARASGLNKRDIYAWLREQQGDSVDR